MLHSHLITTNDGSHSLFVPQLNEHYHSIHGAIQEARHVFIEAGLNATQLTRIDVLEIGLGTGLNAYLTLLEAEKRQVAIHYTSLELHPLDIEKAEKLNYSILLNKEDEPNHFMNLHRASWNIPVKVTPYFTLHKIQMDFSNPHNLTLDSGVDVIYFDAFAPEKQPEMWTQQVFDKLFEASNPEGLLTTYCAKGVVRRTMQGAGFEVEKLQGPPGKREMLRAKKPTL